METYQKLDAILKFFKAEANGDYATAYARMAGALMAYASDETADALMAYYQIKESN
jgi:hypothetical protein